MTHVVAHFYIKHEHIDTVKPLFQELVRETRKEKGCLAYEVFIDETDPGHFVFIEHWQDANTLEIHGQSEHFTRLVPAIMHYQAKDKLVTLLKPFL